MGEEFTYNIDCQMCGVETEVTVITVDERPLHCPMCGMESEDVELIED